MCGLAGVAGNGLIKSERYSMKYEVEGWNKWEYPSHWDFEESFDSLEEAIDWIMLQDYPDNYRVIQELHRGGK